MMKGNKGPLNAPKGGAQTNTAKGGAVMKNDKQTAPTMGAKKTTKGLPNK